MGFELSPSKVAGGASKALQELTALDRIDDPLFMVWPNRYALCRNLPLAKRRKGLWGRRGRRHAK